MRTSDEMSINFEHKSWLKYLCLMLRYKYEEQGFTASFFLNLSKKV